MHYIWEKVEVIMLVKSNRISMIHLISLNKANRQKRRRNKKRSSLDKESSFLRYNEGFCFPFLENINYRGVENKTYTSTSSKEQKMDKLLSEMGK